MNDDLYDERRRHEPVYDDLRRGRSGADGRSARPPARRSRPHPGGRRGAAAPRPRAGRRRPAHAAVGLGDDQQGGGDGAPRRGHRPPPRRAPRDARWLRKEREEYLAKMRADGDEITDAARARAEQMVQRTEVVKAAEHRARRIVERCRGRGPAPPPGVRGLLRPEASPPSRSCWSAPSSSSVAKGREKLQATNLAHARELSIPRTRRRGASSTTTADRHGRWRTPPHGTAGSWSRSRRSAAAPAAACRWATLEAEGLGLSDVRVPTVLPRSPSSVRWSRSTKASCSPGRPPCPGWGRAAVAWARWRARTDRGPRGLRDQADRRRDLAARARPHRRRTAAPRHRPAGPAARAVVPGRLPRPGARGSRPPSPRTRSPAEEPDAGPPRGPALGRARRPRPLSATAHPGERRTFGRGGPATRIESSAGSVTGGLASTGGGSVATLYPSRLAHRSAPEHDLRTTTMAVPKKKTSKSKSRSRRASAWRLDAPSRSVCPRCGPPSFPTWCAAAAAGTTAARPSRSTDVPTPSG
jgi:ribosomal protein L32